MKIAKKRSREMVAWRTFSTRLHEAGLAAQRTAADMRQLSIVVGVVGKRMRGSGGING